MTMLTCLCWLGNLILKKYRKAKRMRYHEFKKKPGIITKSRETGFTGFRIDTYGRGRNLSRYFKILTLKNFFFTGLVSFLFIILIQLKRVHMLLIDIYNILFQIYNFLKNKVVKSIPKTKPRKPRKQVARRILPPRARKRPDFYGINNN